MALSSLTDLSTIFTKLFCIANRIFLVCNSSRETDKPGTKYPHYTGKASINGTPKQAAAWLNTDKTNDKQPDISIKLSDPQTKEDSSYKDQF